MPFGMISKREDQLWADEGHGRLMHEPTLGRDPQGVNWRFGEMKNQNAECKLAEEGGGGLSGSPSQPKLRAAGALAQ